MVTVDDVIATLSPAGDEQYSATLDLAHEKGPDSYFREFDFGVSHEVLEERGPGGDWPIVKVTGTLPAMLKFLSVYDGDPSYSDLNYVEIKNALSDLAAK